MAIHIALNHKTHYRYDRPVMLGPQTVRLRPAPHCRTPILAYSLKVLPKNHFINWQQDPQANYLARLVFPEKTTEFVVEVDLVAEMAIFNPFDFFLEPYAEQIPFAYETSLARELRPFLEAEVPGPRLAGFLAQVPRVSTPTLNFLVSLNQRVQRDIGYVIRLEQGVQTCEQTLSLGTGSCRDSAWLLVQILRNLGLAARFVSGYLIQLTADVKPLKVPPALPAISPTCTPGPRSISPALDGSVSTLLQGCWRERDTSRWPAPPMLEAPLPSPVRWNSARRISATR
jgi:transglutaminase-like putative cysteine protease